MAKHPAEQATSLRFTIEEDTDPDTAKHVQYGCFSRNWDEEEKLDEHDARRISHKQAFRKPGQALLYGTIEFLQILYSLRIEFDLKWQACAPP